jgi:hypothetical protein
MLHPMILPAAGRSINPQRMDFLSLMAPFRGKRRLRKNNKTAAFKQPLKKRPARVPPRERGCQKRDTVLTTAS